MAWMADGKRFKHSRRVGSRVLTSYFPGPFGAEVAEQVAERRRERHRWYKPSIFREDEWSLIKLVMPQIKVQ